MRKSKKDREIGAVVSSFGFAFEVFKVIAHAVTALGGTMEHLRRIINEPELQQKIAKLLVPASLEIKRPLADGEYRVHVDYDMPCDKETLVAEFSPDGVAPLFYEGGEWYRHWSCGEIDEMSGERVMLVKLFDQETSSENAHLGVEPGYRYATRLESRAFAKAHPEYQRQFDVISYADLMLGTDGLYAMLLTTIEGERALLGARLNYRTSSDTRILFVRK